MKHTLFTLALVLLALLSASCGDKKKVVYQNPLSWPSETRSS